VSSSWPTNNTHRAILPAYGAAGYVPALVLERPLYIRERNDGLYRPITYLCFRVIGEGVVAFIISIITSIVIWFALELRGQFLVFWLTYLTTLIFGIGTCSVMHVQFTHSSPPQC
jgi:hypothetical protein